MRLKKILSLLLCAVLVFGVGFAQLKTCFAQEDPAYEESGSSEVETASEESLQVQDEESGPDAEENTQESSGAGESETFQENSEPAEVAGAGEDETPQENPEQEDLAQEDGEETQTSSEENEEQPSAEENQNNPEETAGTEDAETPQEDPEQENAATPEDSELPVSEDNGVFDPEPADGLWEAEEIVDPAWEYPSAWEGYEDNRSEGYLLAAEQEFLLSKDLISRLDTVSLLLAADGAPVNDAFDNFADIFAVYAILSGQTTNYPYGVNIEKSDFASVFWRMVRVTGASCENGTILNVRRLSAAEAAEFYNFSESKKAELAVLMESADSVNSLVERSVFSHLSEDELENIFDMIPGGISVERRSVLMAALSIEGKVDYFWGGKSLACGWDDRWGEMRTVSNMGSESYGTYRPLGLDASGFVSWVFNNAFAAGVGSLSLAQWEAACFPTDWEDARPGDIALADGHMGIVLTVSKEGPSSIIHCSREGVNITDDASLFDHIVRPIIYGELHTPSEAPQETAAKPNQLPSQEGVLPADGTQDEPSSLPESETEAKPYIKPDEEDAAAAAPSDQEKMQAKPDMMPDNEAAAKAKP